MAAFHYARKANFIIDVRVAFPHYLALLAFPPLLPPPQLVLLRAWCFSKSSDDSTLGTCHNFFGPDLIRELASSDGHP